MTTAAAAGDASMAALMAAAVVVRLFAPSMAMVIRMAVPVTLRENGVSGTNESRYSMLMASPAAPWGTAVKTRSSFAAVRLVVSEAGMFSPKVTRSKLKNGSGVAPLRQLRSSKFQAGPWAPVQARLALATLSLIFPGSERSKPEPGLALARPPASSRLDASPVRVPEDEVMEPPEAEGPMVEAWAAAPAAAVRIPEATLRRLPAGTKISRSPA